MSAFVSRSNRGEVAAIVRDPKRSGTRAGVKMGSLMSAEKASGEVAGPKIPVYKKRYVANEPMHASIHLSLAEPVWIRPRPNFAPGRARFEACLSRAFFFDRLRRSRFEEVTPSRRRSFRSPPGRAIHLVARERRTLEYS